MESITNLAIIGVLAYVIYWIVKNFKELGKIPEKIIYEPVGKAFGIANIPAWEAGIPQAPLNWWQDISNRIVSSLTGAKLPWITGGEWIEPTTGKIIFTQPEITREMISGYKMPEVMPHLSANFLDPIEGTKLGLPKANVARGGAR